MNTYKSLIERQKPFARKCRQDLKTRGAKRYTRRQFFAMSRVAFRCKNSVTSMIRGTESVDKDMAAHWALVRRKKLERVG
jgi:hypothetical protein